MEVKEEKRGERKSGYFAIGRKEREKGGKGERYDMSLDFYIIKLLKYP